MLFDNLTAWSFAAQTFFRRLWLWLLIGFVQAYCFALGTFFLSFLFIRFLFAGYDKFFVAFARHIHIFFVWQYVENLSVVGALLVGLLGFLFLCGAFWLHFCVSRFAAYFYDRAGKDDELSLLQMFLPETGAQLLRVLGVSFCVSFLTALGCIMGVLPGVFLHIRLFAVFPLLADYPELPFVSVICKSWSVTRLKWRLIAQFLVEAFLLYLSLMYLCSYLFLVVVVPLARYALCRMLVKNLP